MVLCVAVTCAVGVPAAALKPQQTHFFIAREAAIAVDLDWLFIRFDTSISFLFFFVFCRCSSSSSLCSGSGGVGVNVHRHRVGLILRLLLQCRFGGSRGRLYYYSYWLVFNGSNGGWLLVLLLKLSSLGFAVALGAQAQSGLIPVTEVCRTSV